METGKRGGWGREGEETEEGRERKRGKALPAYSSPHAAAAAIDRYLLPAGPASANGQQPSSGFAAVCPCRDRQTDGRTPCRFIDPAPHTVRAMPEIMSLYPNAIRSLANRLQPCFPVQICWLSGPL